MITSKELHGLGTESLTIEQARTRLRELEEAAAAAAAEAEELRVERERQLEAFVCGMTSRVAILEQKVADGIAETQQRAASEHPSIAARANFRAYLRGQIAPLADDLVDAETRASYSDAIARDLLGLARECQATMAALIDPSLELHVPESDPLARRVDVVEVLAWRAFITRGRVCAGELEAVKNGRRSV